MKLTIGMAVRDDFDGACVTVQSIRLFHPEVTEETEILVVDNHPEGPAAEALRALEWRVPGYRYVPHGRWRSTAVKDVVFREAAGTFVLCVDCHVIIAPGALRRLIAYFDEHSGTDDLLQGPLLQDDFRTVMSHMDPVWRGGLFGVWATDSRAEDADAEPFEIPMQGTGLFACRRAAWPGFNPRFVGFSGEEGYLHEKFRRRGGRTLCLPFLRWLHRLPMPTATPYRNTWEDRVRNYLIGFSEVGLDLEPVHTHFLEHLGREAGERELAAASADLANPFHFFDAIYVINLDAATGRREEMDRRFEALGIDWRVRRFAAIAAPENHHIGCALSHRAVIEEARRLGLSNVLVFEDDCRFLDQAPVIIAEAVAEIDSHEWSLLYLGGCRWGRAPASIPGCTRLVRPDQWTCTHAIAYSERVFDRLLAVIPPDVEGVAAWLATEAGIDQYLARNLSDEALAIRPSPTTQASILQQEDEDLRHRYL